MQILDRKIVEELSLEKYKKDNPEIVENDFKVKIYEIKITYEVKLMHAHVSFINKSTKCEEHIGFMFSFDEYMDFYINTEMKIGKKLQ